MSHLLLKLSSNTATLRRPQRVKPQTQFLNLLNKKRPLSQLRNQKKAAQLQLKAWPKKKMIKSLKEEEKIEVTKADEGEEEMGEKAEKDETTKTESTIRNQASSQNMKIKNNKNPDLLPVRVVAQTANQKLDNLREKKLGN